MDIHSKLKQQVSEQRRQEFIAHLEGASIEELRGMVLRQHEQLCELATSLDRIQQSYRELLAAGWGIGKTHADVQLPKIDGGSDR